VTATGRGGPDGRLAELRRWPASALALRAVMVLAPVGAVLLAAPAGDAPPPPVLAIVLAASLGFARDPESGLGLLALGSVVAWWCLVQDDGLHPAVLPASVLLLVAHVAGLVAAYGPGGVRVDRAVGSVWFARSGLVALSAPLVWVVARVAGEAGEAGSGVPLWEAGLGVAVLAVVAGALALGADHAPAGRRSGR
jgi:hypothetical protein